MKRHFSSGQRLATWIFSAFLMSAHLSYAEDFEAPSPLSPSDYSRVFGLILNNGFDPYLYLEDPAEYLEQPQVDRPGWMDILVYGGRTGQVDLFSSTPT